MIIKKETEDAVSKLLGISKREDTQDWEFEYADRNRIPEFVRVLILEKLSIEEKYAIVSLILASYDDYLNVNIDAEERLWNEIVKLLENDKGLYEEVLNYWALWGTEEEEMTFKITPKIRSYLGE